MREIFDKIAIVILNYNSKEMTEDCYKSLRSLNKELNIVIVDNNSNDNSKDMLNKLNKENNTYILYNNVNSGYASGNNLGLKFVSNHLNKVEVAFVLNPDILVDTSSVFENLYNALVEDEQMAAITALTIYNGKFNFPNDCAWHMLSKFDLIINGSLIGKVIRKNLKYKQYNIENNIAYVDIIQGCFFGIKMDVLRKIEYFDENTFLYCEEMILHQNIKKLGLKSGVYISNYINHNHYEKDKTMNNNKSKLFHLKCFRDSRKYVIRSYINGNRFYKIFARLFLDFDFFLKKVIINLQV